MASFVVPAGKIIAMRKENLCDISTHLGKIFNQKKNIFTENINYSESGPFKTTFPPINYLFEVFLIYADVNRNLGSSLCEICFQIQQALYATSNEILIRLTICCRPFLKLEPAFRRCSLKEVFLKISRYLQLY